ncbi:hypothetical protein DRO59_09435 [Candidatus Bathyarchaeota archaeon]|nr:MAG: hypothetical protein DRO59_09435 [Candidatus Bathyarchaeota archaeon]
MTLALRVYVKIGFSKSLGSFINELVFAASGVTKGELLDGVRFIPNGAIVSSICMRLPSGTVENSEATLRFKGHPVYKRFLT